jgi:membrane complex biogenesis BtpA family protein
MAFTTLFPISQPLIGVIHLRALPGSPLFDGDLERVYGQALLEAAAYTQHGCDGIIVENFLDRPFYPDRVPAETVAAMSAIIREVVKSTSLPIGVNVLRNDAYAAMSIAAATGAHFIRVNVHSGAVLADQGIIEGRAFETLRLRASLRSKALIFADVAVKHAAPLAPRPLAEEVHDLASRGMVDAIIVSGSGTGAETDPAVLETAVRHSALPVLIGSGTTVENLSRYALAGGFIVGSYLKQGGKVSADVDPQRVRAMAEAVAQLRSGK